MAVNYSADQCITYSQMNLIFNARNLWRELATWTRSLLISKTMGIGNEEEVFKRLYEVPQKYAAILHLIFGNKISEDYMNLLSSQIVLINELIMAQMAGDAETVKRIETQLYENVAQRAAFLASINPFWNEEQWRNLMYPYIYDTLLEIATFLAGDYIENIKVFDNLMEHAAAISDYFAEGLFHYIIYNPEENGLPQKETGCIDVTGEESKPKKPGYIDQCITYEQMSTIYSARNFWYELATWTRAYMVSKYVGIGNASAVLERLHRVPEDYSKKLEAVFGEKITEDYKQL